MSLNVYTANDDDDDGEGGGEDDNDDRSGVLLPIHQSPWSSPPPHALQPLDFVGSELLMQETSNFRICVQSSSSMRGTNYDVSSGQDPVIYCTASCFVHCVAFALRLLVCL